MKKNPASIERKARAKKNENARADAKTQDGFSHSKPTETENRKGKRTMKTQVENMISSNGNAIPNQFEIRTPEGIFFQSYRTIIAFKPNDGRKTQLDSNAWDYSVTTGKYRNQFLGERKADTKKKIASGKYELVDLN